MRALPRVAVFALAALTLAACAATPDPDQIAQATMIGQSARQIRACLGPPLTHRAAAQATEIWTYPGVTSTATPPWAAGLDLAASRGPEACDVGLVMTNGAVSQVTYALADGRGLPSGRQCAFAPEPCAGWATGN
jgi:hypothetical protein